jgi:hypothetical protein
MSSYRAAACNFCAASASFLAMCAARAPQTPQQDGKRMGSRAPPLHSSRGGFHCS